MSERGQTLIPDAMEFTDANCLRCAMACKDEEDFPGCPIYRAYFEDMCDTGTITDVGIRALGGDPNNPQEIKRCSGFVSNWTSKTKE